MGGGGIGGYLGAYFLKVVSLQFCCSSQMFSDYEQTDISAKNKVITMSLAILSLEFCSYFNFFCFVTYFIFGNSIFFSYRAIH